MRGQHFITPFLFLLVTVIFLAKEGSAKWDKCVEVPKHQQGRGNAKGYAVGYGRSVHRRYPPQPKVEVATCEFGEALEDSIEGVQKGLKNLTEQTAKSIDAQHEKIKDLQKDVKDLQEPDAYLTRIAATIFPVISGEARRPFCEIYNMGEALEICRLLGYFNPKVHFVHVDCVKDGNSDECPKTFWKIRQNCYRPNDPKIRGGSSFFECFYDPLPRHEKCKHILWISCNGFSNHFRSRDWSEIKTD